MALEGDRGGSAVIKVHTDMLQLVEVAAEELTDCDTTQALEKLKQKKSRP